MPKSLLTLSAIHKKDRNRRPSLSSSQHKIVSPKILPTGPNGIPAFAIKRTPPQAIKHNGNRQPLTARSLPARHSAVITPLPASAAQLPPPRKQEDDDDASSTAGSDMEVDIEALDDDDSLTSYAFRKPRRRPSESTVTPASSYADITGPPPAPAAKTVSAQELAEVYLPSILSTSAGALPIRAMTAALIEMIPLFAEIPPPKQRRLIVKALECRKGELFEKVSWGHWSYIGHNPQALAASAPSTMHFGQAKKKSVKKTDKIDDVSYPVVFNFDNDMDSSSEESDWPADDDETDEEDWRAMGVAGILERCARRESQGRMQAFYMQREISRDDEDAAIEALVRMSESY